MFLPEDTIEFKLDVDPCKDLPLKFSIFWTVEEVILAVNLLKSLPVSSRILLFNEANILLDI